FGFCPRAAVPSAARTVAASPMASIHTPALLATSRTGPRAPSVRQALEGRDDQRPAQDDQEQQQPEPRPEPPLAHAGDVARERIVPGDLVAVLIHGLLVPGHDADGRRAG